MTKIREVSGDNLIHYSAKISVLIETATTVETDGVLERLLPLPTEGEVIKIFSRDRIYYLGVLGIYGVVLVQSEMGSLGAFLTTIRSIELWQPKAIIMVGVAFGIDSKKQNIGDVLVSSHIIPYEFSKIENKRRIYRFPAPPASALIVNRIRQIRDWKSLIKKDIYAKLYVGPILTGDKLIDSKDFKLDLTESFPNAIGGEMESVGIYAAASEKKIEWIIIKGICDFADGNKGKNKDEYQSIAIRSAVSFTEKVLTTKFGFQDLGFMPLFEPDDVETSNRDARILTDLLALFEAIDNGKEGNPSDVFKVAARQIVQTDTDNRYNAEAYRIQMLVPPRVLASFEKRIQTCWDNYNEVLTADDAYLPSEIDRATSAVMQCVCRELRRLSAVNGGALPSREMQDYWNDYKC